MTLKERLKAILINNYEDSDNFPSLEVWAEKTIETILKEVKDGYD